MNDHPLTEPEVRRLDLTGVDQVRLLSMYRRMLEAREFEEQLYYLFLTTEMPGTMHQSTGQEAVAVGVIGALNDDDWVASTHRGHAHCIAKGVPLNEMMAEMFARRTGSCRGMGGSLHLTDFRRGMLGAFAIVGAGIPIAAGAALSARIRKTGQVAVAFFGDGAINEGVFHETLNMAALWRLPVIFVCENNHFALSLTVAQSSAVSNLASRSAAYGIPGESVDGNDVVAVYRTATRLVDRARRGDGPSLLECVTYRIRGHSRFEPSPYRRPEEVEGWRRRDPIQRLEEALQASGWASADELERIRLEVKAELEAAIAFARAGDPVQPDDFWNYVSGDESNA